MPRTGLELLVRGKGLWRHSTTDGEGVLVLDPARTGEVGLHPVGGKSLLPVAVPPGQIEHTVTLKLPATDDGE